MECQTPKAGTAGQRARSPSKVKAISPLTDFSVPLYWSLALCEEGRESGGKHSWSGGSFTVLLHAFFTSGLVQKQCWTGQPGPWLMLHCGAWGQAARLRCGSPLTSGVAGSKLFNLSETTQLCVLVAVVFICKMRLLILITSWGRC